MYKILLIDDEPRIIAALQRFLVNSGFEVAVAFGGEEAIRILHSDIEIDLVALDMKMPRVTGFDVLREIGRINKKIPAIILTGSIDVEKYLNDLQGLGYTDEDILYEPVDLFTLLAMVKKKLGI